MSNGGRRGPFTVTKTEFGPHDDRLSDHVRGVSGDRQRKGQADLLADAVQVQPAICDIVSSAFGLEARGFEAGGGELRYGKSLGALQSVVIVGRGGRFAAKVDRDGRLGVGHVRGIEPDVSLP